MLVWQDKHRKRFLVHPFTAQGEESSNNLHALAFDMTSHVLEELQLIGGLLSTKQVQPANTIRTDSDALNLIISGGLELHTLSQMAALSQLELEATNVRIPLKLFSIIAMHLATLRLTGTLQKQKDGSLSIRVELSQRSGGKPLVVNTRIKSRSSTNQI